MRRVIVCLKPAIDVSQLKVDTTTRELRTTNASRKISDFDRNALEEAIRLKEKNAEMEISTLTVSSEDVKSIVREGLAMGADKAYLVSDLDLGRMDTLGTAYVLAGAVRKIGQVDLILCGESSLDGFSGLVGPRLAELLDLPQITSVRKLSVEGNTVFAERVLEDACETIRAKMPTVVTVTREINQPRIPSLMMIMKASKKEIVNWHLADLSIQREKIESKIDVLETLVPEAQRKRIMITGESVQEIARKLVKALIRESVLGE